MIHVASPDQSEESITSCQVLTIDEEQYKDDPDMMYIIHKLIDAASDPEVLQAMNVEDEYFSAIESRDTAIMKRDQRIAEQNNQIAQLKSMVRALVDNGLSIESIAQMTNRSVADIQTLL